MKADDPRLARFGIREDIFGTPALVRAFDRGPCRAIARALEDWDGIVIAGEGSSQSLPAGRARSRAGAHRSRKVVFGGGRALRGRPLGLPVLALSRSGRSREILDLCASLEEHDAELPLFRAGALEERAFAATRSVVNAALIVDAVFDLVEPQDQPLTTPSGLGRLANAIESTLDGEVPRAAVDAVAGAEAIWFCGGEHGVAEELALKCCELARKRAASLEGTRVLHGVRAVLGPRDLLVLVEPETDDIPRVTDLCRARGVPAIAISGGAPPLPAVPCVSRSSCRAYSQLVAGWNLLVTAGMDLGADLDGTDLRL